MAGPRGRRQPPDPRSTREGPCLQRHPEGVGPGRSGRHHRRSARRRDHPHDQQHLRLGPAHVRRPHQRRGGQDPRPREHGDRLGGRPRRAHLRRRRPGLGAVQHRLWHLPQLHEQVDVVLHEDEPDSRDGRRRLRLRRHGALRRRAGAVPARAARRLQPAAAAAGQRARERLHHAVGHLPDRLARRRAVRDAARRPRRSLRWRTGRADGRAQRGAAGSLRGVPGGQAGRPAQAGREHRRHPDRLLRR